MKRTGSSWMAGIGASLRWLVPAGIVALAGLLGMTTWSILYAQEPGAPDIEFPYDSIPILPKLRGDTPDSKKEVSEVTRLKGAVSKGEKPLQGNEAQFDGYFNGLVFPKMTQKTDIPNLGSHRREFFKQVAQVKEAPVHEHLMQLTLKAMKVIAAGPKYHPAARHNAMLIIGELNDREMVATGENKSPADPMRAALTHMLEEVVKPGTPDYLRVAALVGIQRHAELDLLQVQERRMPEVTRTQIIDKMVAMVGAPIPTDPSLAVGRQWIRRQAIDVLGTVGQVGADGKVFATLFKVISTPSEPLLVRATAAGAIGRLNFPPNFKADTKDLMVQIASITLQAAEEEGKRLEQRATKREEILERGGGLGDVLGPMAGPIGRGGPGMVGPPPPIFGGPQPGGEAVASPIDPLEKRDLDYARVASRRLRAIVAACYGSIAGIRAADKGLPLFLKTNADPTNLGKVGRPLKEMAEFLEDDIRDVYLFEEDLKQRTLNLSQALAGFAPAAKPATTTPMPMPMTPDDPLGGR